MWSNKETGLIRLGCICETSSAGQEMRWDPIYEPFLHSFFKQLKCFSVNLRLWELFIQLNLVENWLTKFAYQCNVTWWYNKYWDMAHWHWTTFVCWAPACNVNSHCRMPLYKNLRWSYIKWQKKATDLGLHNILQFRPVIISQAICQGTPSFTWQSAMYQNLSIHAPMQWWCHCHKSQ